jgi:hypothetical protein
VLDQTLVALIAEAGGVWRVNLGETAAAIRMDGGGR